MSEKRYAIVKIQEHFCEAHQIVNEGDTICECEINKSCRYGDTKEQLIRKVQQALFKSVFTEDLQKAVSIVEQERIYKQYRPMAEKVVEFLGVK